MNLDTHGFRKRQRAHASLKCTSADHLQGGQRHAVPDPDVRLQRLRSSKIESLELATLVTFLFLPLAEDKSEHMSRFSLLTRPSLSTPAICPVAIRILSGWMAKLAERWRQHRPANSKAAPWSHDSPLDAVGVPEVMPLSPLFIVKQNDDGGDEINNLAGWKEVNIGPAVSATVAIATERQGAPRKHLETLSTAILKCFWQRYGRLPEEKGRQISRE